MRKVTIRISDEMFSRLAEAASGGSVAKVVRDALEPSFGPKPQSRVVHLTRYGAPLPVEIPLDVIEQVTPLIREGNYIRAIKDVRAATGLGLYEAKFSVDILRDESELAYRPGFMKSAD